MISHPRSLIRCIGAIAAVLSHVFIALPVLGLQQKPIVESLRTLDPNVLTEAARNEHAQKLASTVRAASRPPTADLQTNGARSQIALNGNNSGKESSSCWKPNLGRFHHRPKSMAVHLTRNCSG